MTTAMRLEPAKWKAFLDAFSRQYGGREVNISLMSSHIVAWRTMGVARFNGIWMEEFNGAVTVMITLESDEHGLLTHTVSSPTFLSWDEDQRVLALEHRDGSTDLLQLHARHEFV